MKRKINRLLAGLVAITMGISEFGSTGVLAADENDPVMETVSEAAVSEDVPEDDVEICEMEFMSLTEDDLVDPEELNRDFDDQEEVILEVVANFVPRTTAPTSDNPYYYSSTYNPFVGTSYGPPKVNANCTWYAYGRASEILGRKAGLCTANASNWYSYTKDGYQRGDTPRLGAVACKKGANHVAVVEGIDYSNNTVALSNSAWNGQSFYMTYNADASKYQYIYLGDFTTENSNPPQITSAGVTEINRESGYYTVKATVTAEAGLDRIEFPTWTTYNGQDDLPGSWPRGTVTPLGNNNYEATYTVQISDHNNERGQYNTHVYAFDSDGRSVMAIIDSVNMDEQPSEPISFDVNLPAKGKANIYNIMCEKWGGQIKISKYVSSNKKVASVNKKGIVTGKKEGSATIKAYIKSGKENVEVGSVIVSVSKPVFKFTNVDLTYAGKSINARDYLSNLAAGATTKWSIAKSSQKIATIDENTGVITAGEKSGNVSVKCTISTYGYSCSYTAKLKVKIPKPSKSIKIKDGKSKNVDIKNVSAYTSVYWKSSSPALTIEATKKPFKVKVSVDSSKDPSVLTQPATLTAVIDGVEYKTNVVVKP